MQADAAGCGPTLDTASEVASLDSQEVYQVGDQGRCMIWVPAGANSLEKQLLVCAHLEAAEHRGVDATMARLERNSYGRVWLVMCWARLDHACTLQTP